MAGMSANQGAGVNLSLNAVWQYFLLFSYAMMHKLGLVTIALALFHYFSPSHWPKPILTLITGFILALVYNYLLIYYSSASAMTEHMSLGELFQTYLIYYCIGGMAIGLIGSILSKRLIKPQA